MRIFLVGYMYSGKSTVGRRLAAAMGMDFVDLDRAFEQKYKLTLPMFFAKYDEAAFRTLEAKLLREVGMADNIVVATGGGTPCYGGNMDYMLAQGTVVYLEMSVAAILSRAAVSKNPRPLLQNKTATELQTFVEGQFAKREPIYSRAPLKVSALSVDLNDLVSSLQNLCS